MKLEQALRHAQIDSKNSGGYVCVIWIRRNRYELAHDQHPFGLRVEGKVIEAVFYNGEKETK